MADILGHLEAQNQNAYKIPRKLYIAPVEIVTAVPAAVTDFGVAQKFNEISTAITFDGSDGFTYIELEDGAKDTSPYKAEAAGHYEHTLDGILGNNTDKVRAVLNKYPRRVIAVVEFSDGTRYVWGTLANPCMFSKRDYDSSGAGFAVGLMWKNRDLAAKYTSTLTVIDFS